MEGNFLLDPCAAVNAAVLVITGIGIARPCLKFKIQMRRKYEIVAVGKAGSYKPALVTMFR